MTEPIKPGDTAGNPNPGQATPTPGQVPGQPPVTPAVPGQAQTPPVGVTPPVTPPVDTGTVPLKALQEEREKRQALQQELEQVRQQVAQTQQPNGGTVYNAPNQGQAPAQQARDQAREHINRLWETDPREAVKAEISQSLTYYDSVNATVEQQANHLAGKYQDFNAYRQQAMNYIRTLPYDQRAQNGIVELAYMVARGQNVDTLVQSREQELMEKFRTGQLAGSLHQPAGASGQPQIPAGQITLTPDQAAAAQAMGLSPADYAANMKA